MKRVMATLACALVIAGCAPSGGFGPVAVYRVHGRFYESTVFDGVVKYAQGCTTAVMNGTPVVLAFPSDEVSWDAATSTVTYGGQPLVDGDLIHLRLVVDFGSDPASVPKACPFARHVYVLQSHLT